MRALDEKAVHEQLERLLSSKAFDASERNRKFLRYVVEETLGGRAMQIKAYCIAVSVFKREPNFDPQLDPIVRLEAGRLRRSLEHYYLTDGRDDPIRIVIPKGSYVPHFEPGDGGIIPGPAGPEPAEVRRRRLPKGRFAVGGTALASLVGIVLFAWLHAGVSLVEPEALALSAASPVMADQGVDSIQIAPFHFYGPMTKGAALDQSTLADALTEQVVHLLADRMDLAVSVANPGSTGLMPGLRLDGSVQRDEGQVHVLMRLGESATGLVLWSERFDQLLTQDNAVALPRLIGSAIVARITQPDGILFQTMGRRLHAKPPKDLTARDCSFLASLYRYNRTAQEHALIRGCLENRSAGMDDAAVWAALSLIAADEQQFGFNRRADAGDPLDRALEMALRAVERDPDSSQPRIALYTAYCLRHQYDLCFAAGDQALAVAADDSQVLADMGLWHVEAGDSRRGAHLLKRAMMTAPSQAARLLPVYGLAQARLGGAMALVENAEETAGATTALYAARAVALVQLGRLDEAQAIASRILSMDPGFAERAAQRYRSQPLPPSLDATLRDSLFRAGLRLPD